MNAAYQTFIGEYNRVVNSTPTGGGSLSDSSRHEAMATFSNNPSPDAKAHAFRVLTADMAARRQAQQNIIAQRESSLSNIGAPPQQGHAASDTAAPVRVSNRAQAMALRPGTHFITPDGRRLIR